MLLNQKIKPMLCTRGKPFNDKNWIFELKLDGTRAIFFVKDKKIKIQNRRLKDITYRYPEFPNINVRNAIFDGELVVLNEKGIPDFYKLETREQTENKFKIKLLSESMPATYFIFDILFKDGKDLTKLPLSKRKEILSQTLTNNDYYIVLDYINEKGKNYFNQVKKRGLEGIVAKKLDSIYEIGKRSKNWIKIKNNQTADVIIVGYTSMKRELSSLLLAVYHNNSLVYIGKVGTGFSDSQRIYLKSILDKHASDRPILKINVKDNITWIKPYYVCEVKYLSLSPNHELRAPVFLRIRYDKDPKECLLEDIL